MSWESPPQIPLDPLNATERRPSRTPLTTVAQFAPPPSCGGSFPRRQPPRLRPHLKVDVVEILSCPGGSARSTSSQHQSISGSCRSRRPHNPPRNREDRRHASLSSSRSRPPTIEPRFSGLEITEPLHIDCLHDVPRLSSSISFPGNRFRGRAENPPRSTGPP